MGFTAMRVCDGPCGERKPADFVLIKGQASVPKGWIFCYRSNERETDLPNNPSLVCCGREVCKVILWKHHHPEMFQLWAARQKTEKDRLNAWLEFEAVMLKLDAKNDPLAESVRDAMDSIWYALTDEEHAELDRRTFEQGPREFTPEEIVKLRLEGKL